MSYNLCNLPKQITTVNGKTVKYTYFGLQNTYGRFMSIDPKAESFYHISPYAYCAGDPVNLVDPDGEATKVIITSVEIYHRKDGELQEMHKYDHRGGENFKKNHEHISGESTIDRKKFNKDRREYWNNEFPTNTD